MRTEYWEALLQKTRRVLASHKKLVVVGWRDSNHDRRTRKLIKRGMVVFCHKAPDQFGSSVGLVVCNPFISHSEFERIKVQVETHPVVITNGEIKRLLSDCTDLLQQLVAKTLVVADAKNCVDSEAPSTPKLPVLEETFTTLLNQGPQEEKKTMEPESMQRFAQLFKAEAERTRDGLVGKNTLGRIREEAGIAASNTVLVEKGWLVPHTSEGATNVGKYSATPKLTDLMVGGISVLPPSADPVVRARSLVAERAQVVSDITLQKVRLLELEEKLKKIEETQAVLARLEDLMK